MTESMKYACSTMLFYEFLVRYFTFKIKKELLKIIMSEKSKTFFVEPRVIQLSLLVIKRINVENFFKLKTWFQFCYHLMVIFFFFPHP